MSNLKNGIYVSLRLTLTRETKMSKEIFSKKTLGGILILLLFGMFVGALIGWNILVSERTIRKSYLKEMKQVIAEKDDLTEQITTLTKGNKNIVPIINKLRPQLDDKIVEEIAGSIIKNSREYRLPPEFVVYLIKRESGFNVLAKSNKGAVGLMQVLPKWHQDKMKKDGITNSQLYHIDKNIKLGCWIFREYYDETGSVEKALKKYVGGNHNGYINDILIGYTNETIPKKIKKEE